jgi:alkylation response protein AidB-like acyl-CoA dehydrogenase
MDLSLSEEQRLLKASAERFAADDYGFERRREIMRSTQGMSDDVWRQFADFGWLGTLVPERCGGLGMRLADMLVLGQALAPALVVEPLGTVGVLAATVTRRCAPEPQAGELLPRLVSGDWRATVAMYEPGSRYNLACVETTAARKGPGFVLNGQKCVVAALPQVDEVLVVARESGGTRDRGGISLFRVSRNAPGVSVIDYETVEGGRAGELRLENVEVPAAARWDGADDTLAEIERAADLMAAYTCADAVGAMQSALRLTAEYLRNRKQFGQPLGAFQALQHRMADMYIAEQRAVSALTMLMLQVDASEGADLSQLVSAAKAQIGRCGHFVAQQAVQLHGGIGVTDEYVIGHYLRRITGFEAAYGDTAWHLQRYARLSEVA